MQHPFLPQSDGIYAEYNKIAETLSESRNNHGAAVICWWEEGSECSSTVGEHFSLNRCVLTDNAAKLYKYDGSGFLLCSSNAAFLLKRLYIRVGILQASKPVRKHHP